MIRTLTAFTLLFLILGAPSLQQTERALDRAPFTCSQPAKEQNLLINEGEKNGYSVRRVEFIGLTYTSDRVVRRPITRFLQEGDPFTHRRLVNGLQSVSRLRMIYPVRPRNVVISLDGPGKAVDMTICFRERRR